MKVPPLIGDVLPFVVETAVVPTVIAVVTQTIRAFYVTFRVVRVCY